MTLDLSMLEAATNATASAKALVVKIDMLIEDADQPRSEFEALDDFAADIKQRGILQPIIVRPLTNGVYKILFGARRYRAARLAQLADVPIIISEDARQHDGYAQVAENRQRKDLTPLEEAAFIEKRLSSGEKLAVIAEKLGVTRPVMTSLCALIKPPAFLLELYHSGKCRNPDLLYRLRKLHQDRGNPISKAALAAPEITRGFLDALSQTIQTESITTVQPPKLHTERPQNDAQPIIQGVPDLQRPPKVRYKVVVVSHRGRQANVLLNQQASTVGLGWIKYLDDGSQHEVVLNECTLEALYEGG
jgi:ParB family transcriptional regulator, chromosome partitioning protein